MRGYPKSRLSIFFGGDTSNALEGIKATNIAEFLRSTLRYNFKHIKKENNWGYGFVHFKNESEKEVFFNYVKDRPLRGPRGKILNFNRARTKNVHNRDEDIEEQPLSLVAWRSDSSQTQPQQYQTQTQTQPQQHQTQTQTQPQQHQTQTQTQQHQTQIQTQSQPQQHQTQTQSQLQLQQHQTQVQTQIQTQTQSQPQPQQHQTQAQAQIQTQTQTQSQQHETQAQNQTQSQPQPQQHQTQAQTQTQTQTQTQLQIQTQLQPQQLQKQPQLQSQLQLQKQQLQSPPYPQYNIFESSEQLIIYVEACGVSKDTIEIEINKFDAFRINIKFNYDQDIEDGLQCIKRSFYIPKNEIKMSIQLPKSFDPNKDVKVELLCGMIKISLEKLEKPIRKKFKINY